MTIIRLITLVLSRPYPAPGDSSGIVILSLLLVHWIVREGMARQRRARLRFVGGTAILSARLTRHPASRHGGTIWHIVHVSRVSLGSLRDGNGCQHNKY